MIHQMHHETSDVRTKERTVNIFLDMQKSRKFIILGRKKKKLGKRRKIGTSQSSKRHCRVGLSTCYDYHFKKED